MQPIYGDQVIFSNRLNKTCFQNEMKLSCVTYNVSLMQKMKIEGWYMCQAKKYFHILDYNDYDWSIIFQFK